MKNYLLWLLLLLVLLQAWIAIQTGPEFHVLTQNEYLKELQTNSNLSDAPQVVGNLETNEYFNGRHGKYLVRCTLIIDVAMLLLLVFLIRKTPSGQKEVKTTN